MRTTEEWGWDALTTLSIPAPRLLEYLERLLYGDADERRSAGGLLYCEVANQGQLYSAAAPCVDVIAEHVRSGATPSPEAVDLLESILNARSAGLRASAAGGTVEVEAYCRRRILEILPDLLSEADGRDAEYFREVCFLVPQLADSSEEVVEFLRSSVASLQGELRRMAVEALEEAEEVVSEGHMP